ncbi:MAG: response regulator [Anaerolineae bacterium]
MTKTHSGTAVPRHFLFVLPSGAVVAQITDTRGQDLYTGELVELAGATGSVTDADLERLRGAGRVEAYNNSFVWVAGLRERHTVELGSEESSSASLQQRKYYLDTGFPAFEQNNFAELLRNNNLDNHLQADIRNERVIIRKVGSIYFNHIDEATEAHDYLERTFPDVFGGTIIAFTTVDPRESQLAHEVPRPTGTSELAAIIASQTDSTVTMGKEILVLVTNDEDRILIGKLCVEMNANVQVAFSGAEALQLLEDSGIDLLIMDLQLPDMHGWEMLGKMREVDVLRHLPVIVIADSSGLTEQSLSNAVAQVDAFLIKPLSKARIRQNIWMALKNRS